jgi:hypothetical protein
MEPSLTFYLSRPSVGTIWSSANQQAVIISLGMAWREDLEAVYNSDQNRFNQAVALINGQALRAAEAFMRSPS